MASISNQAVSLSLAGDHVGAEALHRRALQLKLRTQTMSDIGPALSMNGIGEELYLQGRLDEAEEMLERSLAVRAVKGPRFDAAVTRENLAQVYQAKKDISSMDAMRNAGLPNELCCSNYKCPGQTYLLAQLSNCSKCKSPRYCSVSCQKADWKVRHRAECNDLAAARDAAATVAT